MPELSCIEYLDEGVEKVLDNLNWGGKSKVVIIIIKLRNRKNEFVE